jgi:hypothetical protein
MPFETIPRGRWREFLDDFNRMHGGWLVTVDTAAPRQPAQTVLTGVPLLGVCVDPDRFVIASVRDGSHADHVIDRPVRLRVERTRGGADRGLEIDTAGGEHVTVRFRSAILPEMVDGI